MTRDTDPFRHLHRIPVARTLAGGRPARGVAGSRESFGVLWRPVDVSGLPVVVLFSPVPSAMGWLASSVAAALPAVVVVAAAPARPPSGTLAAAVGHAGRLGADPGALGLIGEAEGAVAALETARGTAVSRLALLSPRLPRGVGIGRAAPGGRGPLPPVLLQYSRGGAAADGSAHLEPRLRAAGVAVRAIDYESVADAWARYPVVVRGSGRALGDLVGFFARGFGTDSTYQVIPGWNLH